MMVKQAHTLLQRISSSQSLGEVRNWEIKECNWSWLA
jgi:hypothetical protein